MHASLYHAWARMEARLGNLEGLAKLDEHARKHFQSRAPGSAVSPSEIDAAMNDALPPQFRVDAGAGAAGDEH